MKIKDAVAKLEKLMAVVESDKAGKTLVVGNVDLEVKGILSTLIVDEVAIKAAEEAGANVIVSYGEFVACATCPLTAELIKKDMTVISIKADMDVCANGFEGALVNALGLEGNRVTDIIFAENCYKLVVCVPKLPEDYTSTIRKELGKMGVEDGLLGAGYVGTYSEVSDITLGYQWFVTMPGADPFIGNVGDLSKVEVERFEMIIPEHQVEVCVDRLWELHPYEEVEYDVYPIMEKRNHKGYGRVGEFEEAISCDTFIKKVKEVTNATNVCVASNGKEVKKVAVCANLTLCLSKQLIENNVDTIVTSNVDASVVACLKDINIISVSNFNFKSACIKKTDGFMAEEIANVTQTIENIFEIK